MSCVLYRKERTKGVKGVMKKKGKRVGKTGS